MSMPSRPCLPGPNGRSCCTAVAGRARRCYGRWFACARAPSPRALSPRRRVMASTSPPCRRSRRACGNATAASGVRSEDAGGLRAVAKPDLRLAPGFRRVAGGVERIEHGLFLVEIRPVHAASETHDPARLAGMVTDLKLQGSHAPSRAGPCPGRCWLFGAECAPVASTKLSRYLTYHQH